MLRAGAAPTPAAGASVVASCAIAQPAAAAMSTSIISTGALRAVILVVTRRAIQADEKVFWKQQWREELGCWSSSLRECSTGNGSGGGCGVSDEQSAAASRCCSTAMGGMARPGNARRLRCSPTGLHRWEAGEYALWLLLLGLYAVSGVPRPEGRATAHRHRHRKAWWDRTARRLEGRCIAAHSLCMHPTCCQKCPKPAAARASPIGPAWRCSPRSSTVN